MSTISAHKRTKIGHLVVTGAQIRMARGYTKLSAKALAELAGVAESTIKRIEATQSVPTTNAANLDRVKSALEAQGIQFLDTDDTAQGPGVALAKP
ncbi:MAG: helix-turn-helix transcriptional regulator [Pseudomonadota bacterium]